MISMLTGVLGFALLIGIWFAVQALARRQSRCALDQDMLEGHGCGACDHSGACRKRRHAP
ncbi:MAG: hypothetical protein LAO79_16490 [Acidobacteriia bacterium]|nr:hypothetical protein [Terriglobia bacterium]